MRRRARGWAGLAVVVLLLCSCGLAGPSSDDRAAALFDDDRVVDLLAAARAGDADGVAAAIEEGADLHAPSNDSDPRRVGITPLHFAVEFLPPEAVTILLEAGADPRAVGASGQFNVPAYALLRFATEGFVAVMTFDPTLVDTPYMAGTGASLIHGAATVDHATEMGLLIELGADLNAVDSGGKTPLHKAAMSRSVEACLTLVRAGADASLRDSRGDTFLPYLYLVDDISSEEFLATRAELVRELERRGFPVETAFTR